MKLGFVSAILPDLSLEEVVKFAASEGFSCVELMCWPKGKAERRYAGVTHVDLAGFGKAEAAKVKALLARARVSASGLGYYPNPLAPNAAEAKVYVDHLKKVIVAAELLGVGLVNTFIGRDWTKSVDDNWPAFRRVWKPLVKFAEDHSVR
ncbi:MAG: sugar phosphate isomerase/epimerase, partial [Planctomycetes bacterium]|nr:sugar phosphate isomerase/epimerase [Planctomycetota bacterium]